MTKRSYRPRLYTEAKTLKFTKQQMAAFLVLKKHGVNVQDFIREAVRDKIKAEWPQIKEKSKDSDCPF